ncbi:MAG TPA: ATP-binding protein [Chitinophagaceae bacterium]|nr:ATP-binding protein [Chitinophagaceae bacterium]
MGLSVLRRSRARGVPFKSLSIQQRLPLLICILLLSIIITFSWASYLGVKNAALRIGKERLNTLTRQLSSMFGQSVPIVVTTTRSIAAKEPIKKYLQSDKRDADTAVVNALQRLRPDSSWVLAELLNADHQVILSSSLNNFEIKINRDSVLADLSLQPDSCKLGKLYRAGDSIFYPIVAAVSDQHKIIGYLIRWKLQLATAKAIAQFSQLIGGSATLYIGNADGSVWTDLIKPVSSIPVNIKDTGNFFRYTGSRKVPVIASVRPISNTQWVVLIELSQKELLKAPNKFLRSIIILGAILLIIGITIAWMISLKITKPLKELTTAASAIAAGDYSASVPVHRTDELGKLSRAFNAMVVQVHHAKHNLEEQVLQRTNQLKTANKELESFSYSVSHDLRAPLRAVSGYATILKEDYQEKLDTEAGRIINAIVSNVAMMGQLIDDLISFSKIGTTEENYQLIDMKKLAGSCMEELLVHHPENNYKIHVQELPPVYCDGNLIKQVWLNLLGNAIKYSSKKPGASIEIGYRDDPGSITYFVRDNGVGFDMRYSEKLFGVFQRLHSNHEFEGTGIGLALVKRIILKHNGKVWAEGSPGEGATFYFSLPSAPTKNTEIN